MATNLLPTGGLKAAQASRLNRCLGLFGRFGAIGCAATFTLAVILAGILTTALPLTVILAFAGVLRKGIVLNEHDPGVGRGRGTICRGRLSVQTDRSAAHQTCDSGGQCERLYGILHRCTPFFSLGHTRKWLEVDDWFVDRSELERSADLPALLTLYAGSWSSTRRKRLHKNVNEPLISSKLGANQPDGNKN